MSHQAREAFKILLNLHKERAVPAFSRQFGPITLTISLPEVAYCTWAMRDRGTMTFRLRRNCHDRTVFGAYFRRTPGPSQTCPPRTRKTLKKTLKSSDGD